MNEKMKCLLKGHQWSWCESRAHNTFKCDRCGKTKVGLRVQRHNKWGDIRQERNALKRGMK